GDGEFGGMAAVLAANFDLGWYLLAPLALVMAMAWKKMPAFPTMLIGALAGGVMAVIFQPAKTIELAANPALSDGMALLSGVWTALASGYVAHTGDAAVDALLSRGGMESMLNTVWLILCAMTFGAVLERAGFLQKILTAALQLARSTGSLIVTTL